MSSIILSGDTSGTITIAAPAVAGVNTITAPVGTGTMAVMGASTNIVSTAVVPTTAGISIDFTSIPSWIKRITLNFNDVSTTGTSPYLVQIGSGSIQITGYGGQSSSGNALGPTSTAGFVVVSNLTAAAVFGGQIVLTKMPGNIWTQTGNTGASTILNTVSSGSVTLSGALDRLRLTTVAGTDTFDAGFVNIMYE